MEGAWATYKFVPSVVIAVGPSKPVAKVVTRTVVVKEAAAEAEEDPKEFTDCMVTLYDNPARRPEIVAELGARLPFMRCVTMVAFTVAPFVVTTKLYEVAYNPSDHVTRAVVFPMFCVGKVRLVGVVGVLGGVVRVNEDEGVFVPYLSKEFITTEYAVSIVNPVKAAVLGGPTDSVTLIPFWGEFATVTVVATPFFTSV